MYQPRFYRRWTDSDLVNFTAEDQETDIFISAGKDLKTEAEKLIRQYRAFIIEYIKEKPEFEKSLSPLPPDEDAPLIVRSMLRAASLAGVGPMAAVAGAICDFVGRDLLNFTDEVILENGGDIFLKTKKERTIGVYAGHSPLSGKIGLFVKPESSPLGICTSSGTVGHSTSFGRADAVCVLAKYAALADAAATASCNMVKSARDIERSLNFAKSIEGIIGAVVIYKDKVGSIGNIELARSEIT